MVSSIRILARQKFRPSASFIQRRTATPMLLTSNRLIQTTRVSREASKDDNMDKDALNPESNEFSKTGGGDQAAAHEPEAFDPNNTTPEGQEAAGRDSVRVPAFVGPFSS
ncbi:hypothetical protein FH972_023409 [Carpinus fangiana]|uniref:Uncharacterized protein n=1 Tax=Carpinus fangiana TaxID=176857 RepID=A0A5N6KVH9_9ROSI|nr:hypothetical protein FH972_023409 [Carpinus fangiana]